MRLGSSNLLLITAVATLVHDGTNVACKESGWINTGTGENQGLKWKRSPVAMVKSVFQGVKATKELLKGAKQTADSRFEKSGTYVEANSDFASVNPTQVRSFILADAVGKIGMIGNRAIVIKSISETGYPILKIFKPKWIPIGKDKDEPVSFEIVYKKY